ncbi:hypothetical protein D3C75_549380 [compost metagenome]
MAVLDEAEGAGSASSVPHPVKAADDKSAIIIEHAVTLENVFLLVIIFSSPFLLVLFFVMGC